MRIDLATIQDVPELQELQRKAFGPQCIELGWEDAPPMTESLEHAYEEFAHCTTLKAVDDEGRIVGSIQGSLATKETPGSSKNVTDGSLYMGRLMVLPEYRQQGIGKQLFREIQRLLPHNRAWLFTCKQVPEPYEFYLREGFKPFKTEKVGPGLTWVYMEKVQIRLRPFCLDDAEIILSWCKDKHSFRLWSADRYENFPVRPEDMMRQYEGDDKYTLTAIAGENVVGHILLRYPTDDKSIMRLGFIIVDDTKRGRGYGKQMIRLAIEYARRELGTSRITLGVFCDNLSALECYKSVGFRITSEDTYVIDGEEWKGYEMELEG